MRYHPFFIFFFFNDTATTEIYTLSLHDALPIYIAHRTRNQIAAHGGNDAEGAAVVAALGNLQVGVVPGRELDARLAKGARHQRSEEHTSELQSQSNLVCRLLLEKKKTIYKYFFS